MLLDAVLSSDVHGSTTSQVSLLHHEPRPSLLRLLSHLHNNLHSAASLRRTRRHRLAVRSMAGRFHSLLSLPSAIFPSF